VEKDRRFEIFGVPEPIGHLLDGLYLSVDAFTHGVGNAIGEVCQYVSDMPFQRRGGFSHGL
jgi:hypothetical protein